MALMLSPLLYAQQQEPKLEERLLRTPNSNLTFAPDIKTFQNDKSFSGSGKAYVKDFLFEQKVQAKTFHAKDFSGSKDFWAGDFNLAKYPAADPLQRRFIIPNASKTYDTASVNGKNAREAGTTAPAGKYRDSGAFKGRYEDQTNLATDPNAKSNTFQREQEAAKKQLTIDQVRDLLNKNK